MLLRRASRSISSSTAYVSPTHPHATHSDHNSPRAQKLRCGGPRSLTSAACESSPVAPVCGCTCSCTRVPCSRHGSSEVFNLAPHRWVQRTTAVGTAPPVPISRSFSEVGRATTRATTRGVISYTDRRRRTTHQCMRNSHSVREEREAGWEGVDEKKEGGGGEGTHVACAGTRARAAWRRQSPRHRDPCCPPGRTAA